MTPFVGIREGALNADPTQPSEPFIFAELTAADAADFDLLSDPKDDSATALERFGRGNLCFGIRDGSRLVAKTWCDLEQVTYYYCRRKLDPGEVYLFAAYADPAYRGRGLAPMMRSACYAELRRRGFSRFYSYSEYLNLPARRFKSKLGAVEENLKIHCDFHGKWSRTLTFNYFRRP